MENEHQNHELSSDKELHLNYNEFKKVPMETMNKVSKLFDFDEKRHKIRAFLVSNGIKATS